MLLFFVGLLGFEPRKTGPESVVLPLHHSPKSLFVCHPFRLTLQRYNFFITYKHFVPFFFKKIHVFPFLQLLRQGLKAKITLKNPKTRRKLHLYFVKYGKASIFAIHYLLKLTVYI